MPTTSIPDSEQVLRELARLLAPYIAEELDRPRPSVSSSYDAETCALFVSPLGTALLDRALTLFHQLSEGGRLSSLELAAAIEAAGPRAIGGMLTSPLKRRAKQLGLPLPFVGGEGVLAYGGIPDPRPDEDPGRTYWADRDGIAERMAEAIRAELKRRPDWRGRRFVWAPGDIEILTAEQVRKIKKGEAL